MSNSIWSVIRYLPPISDAPIILPRWDLNATSLDTLCIPGFRIPKGYPKRTNQGETEETKDHHGSATGFRFVHLNPLINPPRLF